MGGNRRKNAIFTKDQEIFIVEQFVTHKFPSKVKREFRKKYGQSKWLANLALHRFTEVYNRFHENGLSPEDNNPRHQRNADRSDPEKVQVITDYFLENQFNSIAQASKDLKIPESTIQWNLKHKIKMKPYKLTLGQALTAAHEAGRLKFCQWLISQPPEFVQFVIFGDEKWFHLTQHPNRQNTRVWSIYFQPLCDL